MTIYGVALLAVCTLLGAFLGDLLGMALHVKSNVGGVGIAMILLITVRVFAERRGPLSHPVKLGVEFWAALYIPIVVAMAATQNVVGAIKGGPVVAIAAVVTVLVCWSVLALIARLGGADEAEDAQAARVLSGDPE